MEDYRNISDEELEAIASGAGEQASGAPGQADAKIALDLRISRRQLEAARSLATFTSRLFIATGVLAFATIVLVFVSLVQTYSAIRQARMSRTSTSEASSGKRTVSWYLLVPPLGQDAGQYNPSTWYSADYGTQEKCEAANAGAQIALVGVELTYEHRGRKKLASELAVMANNMDCIASDDPRLKRK